MDLLEKFHSGTGAILATPALPPGGGVERFCVTFEFPGLNSRLFIIILASEEQVPKHLKQVSIVGSLTKFSCEIQQRNWLVKYEKRIVKGNKQNEANLSEIDYILGVKNA